MQTVAAIAFGGVIGIFVPDAAMLSASAEMIAFVTLIMAGLLPAMILTATAIRGESFSSARVREYGERLKLQLQFWAIMFLFALVTVLAISVAKVISQDSFMHGCGDMGVVVKSLMIKTFVVIGLASLAVVLVRLHAAYGGLRSLLELSVKMAEVQALANDRSFSDGLDAKARRIAEQHLPQVKAD